jgi:hypothetical protein
MRNSALVTAVLLIAVGGGCAESVANSPECERWIADYRQKLAESRPVQEVATRQHALKKYVHRQIGQMTNNKPKLVRTASPRDPLRPALTPQQMVKRFQVMCGDLPPAQMAGLVPPIAPAGPPIAPLLVPGSPQTPATATSTPFVPGSPIIPTGPVGASTPPPSGPPTPPPIPPPDTPPAPPVPEPAGVVLMLAGSLLAMVQIMRSGRADACSSVRA